MLELNVLYPSSQMLIVPDHPTMAEYLIGPARRVTAVRVKCLLAGILQIRKQRERTQEFLRKAFRNGLLVEVECSPHIGEMIL
ncbi:hypothetical protein sS8_0310 [Methylocaldum marinum]|uniref:Uncharacterized protein n=1 Tax=Methylocaldum marinum TaxID=1432792 RepID=A0A286P3Q6_9GAMM|nr:hypothetical protein sS8_0310 [Methylocaldum marinum]